jgi:hypothetical protein
VFLTECRVVADKGVQLKASTVAARLTAHLLNEVARAYTHNLCVIYLLMLTFILDIVLVGFLEISYHIPSVICKVMEVYAGEHLSNILVSIFSRNQICQDCRVETALFQLWDAVPGQGFWNVSGDMKSAQRE